MNYIITLFLLTVFSFGSFNYHLKPHTVTKDIKCFFGLQKKASIINGANIINTCYIKTNEGYIVIDSGPTYQYAQQAYRAIQKETPLPVKYIINTSSNELHSLGNSFYKEQGATLIGVKREKSTKNQNISLESKISKEAFLNTHFVPLDISLNADKDITLGSSKIKIKKFGDKLVIHLPKNKIIFVGDFVSDNPSDTKIEHSSTKSWAKTFNTIEKLSWKYIISSHSIKRKRYALADTRGYLKLFQEKPKKIVPSKTVANEKKVFVAKKIEPIPLLTAIKKENKKLKHTPCIKYTNLKQAKRSALREHKFVMIKIEADNCSPCRELNKLLKTNDKVKNMVNRHIKAVKINRDHESLPVGFDIMAAPTILLFKPETNQVLVQLEGRETFEDLEDALKVFVSDSHSAGLALH